MRFYPQEIREIHEEFTLRIRQEMKAVVEVCWGAQVQDRMKQSIALFPLRLWGEYKDVTLFLELRNEHDTSHIIRIVIFVYHPQYFFLATTSTEKGREWRSLYGRRQDLHLTVAAKLGGIKIEEGFYEMKHHPGKYGRINAEQRDVKRSLMDKAFAQLKVVAPAIFENMPEKKRTIFQWENEEPIPEPSEADSQQDLSEVRRSMSRFYVSR